MIKVNKMNKKAYMFTLDLTIAIIILVIGISILFFRFGSGNKTIYFTEQLSEDIIGVMSYTNINDLCVNVGESDCDCPRYSNLTQIVCSHSPCIAPLQDRNGSLLSMISEVITTGSCPGEIVESSIKEIFVTKNVIDEKRFGFALLYQGGASPLLELYNTESYNRP
jgi:hypothetical protein